MIEINQVQATDRPEGRMTSSINEHCSFTTQTWEYLIIVHPTKYCRIKAVTAKATAPQKTREVMVKPNTLTAHWHKPENISLSYVASVKKS